MPEDYTNGIDDDCDGAVDGGAVESFDDLQTFEDTWNPIRGTLTEQLIGFESVPVGFALTTEYADLGWQVDATISAATDVDGVAPNGIQTGWSLDQSWVWDFEEPQQAVGFDLLDVAGSVLLKGYRECTGADQLISVFNEDATAQFVGLIFDSGVERLVIHNETNGDIWGVDDTGIRHLVKMMLMVTALQRQRETVMTPIPILTQRHWFGKRSRSKLQW